MPVVSRPISEPSFLQINKFPPEILAQIFLFCLPSKPSGLSNRTAPINLIWVCGFWRDLAVNTPELWASLELARVRGCFPDVNALLGGWADLSRNRPMSLTYNFPSDHEAQSTVLLPSLIPLAPRLRELNFTIRPDNYVPLLMALSRRGLPLLESLTLSGYITVGTSFFQGPQYMNLSSCGSLHTLSIESIPITPQSTYNVSNTWFATILVPWRQITCLRIIDSTLNATEVVEVLVMCDALEECELLTGCARYNHTTQITTPIVLPHLKRLTLRSDDIDTRNGVTYILNSLTLPALKTLSLSTEQIPSNLFTPSLLSLHRREQFLLQELSLTGDFDIKGLIVLLREFSMLKHLALKLSNLSVYPRLFRFLATRTSEISPLPLPHLVSLDLLIHAPGVCIDAAGHPTYLTTALHVLQDGVDRCDYWGQTAPRTYSILTMLKNRFQQSESAKNSATTGVARLEHVTLRTLRSRRNWGNGSGWQHKGQEWIYPTNRAQALQEEEFQRGLILEFPVQLFE
ncbi:hypothetical protein Hypma_007058 [Hypsizygus marmoreus]|uniref:Uncharacterized protein n=1 Tax=Hypsizygus marmoreus TaxID=39966 RepID=A0A369KBY4_HYPMA|nr:hypothetical protein Hypma_007058 [Hypsizygus marmoreus]